MSNTTPKYDPVQWYDLLIKACKEGDEALLDQVLENLDDCSLGEELPLALAMCQPNISIVKKVLNRTPQYAAQAFVARIKPNHIPLSKRQRAQIFKCVVPHFDVPMVCQPNNKNSNWWSYAVFLMTVEELEQISFSTENQEAAYDDLTFAGLRWVWEHSASNTPDQIALKVQWIVRHNLLTEDSYKTALDKFLYFGHTQAAMIIANHLPGIQALSFQTVDTLLRSRPVEQLQEILPLLQNHALSNRECQNILQSWRNDEYRINPLEYGCKNPKTVDLIYPFIRPLAAASNTRFLSSTLLFASYHVVEKLRSEFPTLWDWDDFYIQLSKNVNLAPTPEEERQMIKPAYWLDYVAAHIQSSKGKRSFLYDLKQSDYHSKTVVLAVLGSGNKALVNKCLYEGGQIDSHDMWLQLAQWADEEFFTRIWTQNGSPVVLTDEIFTSHNPIDLIEAVLQSPLSHIFMNADKIAQWVETASNKNLTVAAVVAARQKSHTMLQNVLQKVTLDSSAALDVLNASIHDIKTLQIAVQHIDPYTDSSSVLYEAAANNNLEAVNFLIPLCNPKANNSAALRVAAERGHIEIVKALLPVSCAKDNDSRALMFAIDNQHLDVALLLWPHSIPQDARDHVDSIEFFDQCAAAWQKSQLQKYLPDTTATKKERKL